MRETKRKQNTLPSFGGFKDSRIDTKIWTMYCKLRATKAGLGRTSRQNFNFSSIASSQVAEIGAIWGISSRLFTVWQEIVSFPPQRNPLLATSAGRFETILPYDVMPISSMSALTLTPPLQGSFAVTSSSCSPHFPTLHNVVVQHNFTLQLRKVPWQHICYFSRQSVWDNVWRSKLKHFPLRHDPLGHELV